MIVHNCLDMAVTGLMYHVKTSVKSFCFCESLLLGRKQSCNQLGTPWGAKRFVRGDQIMSNTFSREAKNFVGGLRPILVTALVVNVFNLNDFHRYLST